MTEVTYPYAYGDARLTMAELEAKATVQNAHPEFWRRLKAMLEAGKGRLGVGTCWRSSDTQERVFLERHYVVTSGGCCSWAGRRYQLKKGMAHAAPPGKSFHESTFHGFAQACDAVGDLAWMHTVEGSYGLKDFRNVGNEPWHIQMVEIANSVTSWKAQGSPQPQKWVLPGTTPPPTTALLGPDVSEYDEGLTISSAPFLIARVSIGLSEDDLALDHVAWARRNRVPFCAYHFVFSSLNHSAAAQADTFHRAVDRDVTIPCMLDWEIGPTDYCHPGGPEQHATWTDVIGVASAIRKLGHKVGLVYTANWYWSEQGKPNMGGVGLGLVNALYGAAPLPTGTPSSIYAARGGDTGPGWQGYGGLTPVFWQYTDRATWGGRSNVDFNAYVGSPADLGVWFTLWPAAPPILEDDDMLFICNVGTVAAPIYNVGDGVRATQVAAKDVDTLKANVEGAGTARWRHPARKDLPILTKMADIPTINAGQRDCLVGKLD